MERTSKRGRPSLPVIAAWLHGSRPALRSRRLALEDLTPRVGTTRLRRWESGAAGQLVSQAERDPRAARWLRGFRVGQPDLPPHPGARRLVRLRRRASTAPLGLRTAHKRSLGSRHYGQRRDEYGGDRGSDHHRPYRPGRLVFSATSESCYVAALTRIPSKPEGDEQDREGSRLMIAIIHALFNDRPGKQKLPPQWSGDLRICQAGSEICRPVPPVFCRRT